MSTRVCSLHNAYSRRLNAPIYLCLPLLQKFLFKIKSTSFQYKKRSANNGEQFGISRYSDCFCNPWQPNSIIRNLIVLTICVPYIICCIFTLSIWIILDRIRVQLLDFVLLIPVRKHRDTKSRSCCKGQINTRIYTVDFDSKLGS